MLNIAQLGLTNWIGSVGGGILAPTVQASNISFSIIGPTTLTIDWDNGNGANRLVIVKSGSAVNSNPVDGSTYTANSVFGSGSQIGTGNYVVYSGTAESVVITGLSENNTYHVRVFEFNGSSGTEKYFTATATGNPSNETTILAVWQYTVGHWAFENNILNSIPDIVNNGDASNNLTYSSGKSGQCGNFTGTNSYLRIPDHNSISFTDDTNDKPFSISLWVNPTSLSGNKWLFNKRGGVSTLAEWQVGIDATGKIFFGIFSQSGTSNFLQQLSNTTISTGVWSFVTCTYNGSHTLAGLKIYINGSAVAMTNNSSGTYVRMSNTTGVCAIGQQAWALTGSSGFIGLIDEVSLFKKEITVSEIGQLYNSSNGVVYRFNYDWMTTYEINGYVIANRDNYVFAVDTYSTGNKLWWSNDRGRTWTSVSWGTVYTGVPVFDKWVGFSYIFDDGTVLFATAAQLYRSADGLQTITPITPKGRGYNWLGNDSDNFLFHTPIDPTRPGTYFMNGANAHQSYDYISGTEVLMWTNYNSVSTYALGTAPTVIWATKDRGLTVQAIFMFGANLNQRDDGSAGGGTTGTILGNQADTTRVVRHGHIATRRPGTNDWYVCTGDFTGQILWLKVTYDVNTGLSSLVTNLLLNIPQGNRYFGVGFNFIDQETIRWSTDVGLGGSAAEMGLWQNDPDNISGGGTIGTGETRIKDLGNKVIYGYLIANNRAIVIGDGGELDTSFGVIESSGSGTVSYIPVTNKTGALQILAHLSPPDSKGFIKIGLGGFQTIPPRLTVFYKL